MGKTITRSTLLCLLAMASLQAQPETGRDFDPQEKIGFHLCLTLTYLGPGGGVTEPVPGEWVNATLTDERAAGGHTHEASGTTRPAGEWRTILMGVPGESSTRQITQADGCANFVYKAKGFAGYVSITMTPESPVFATKAKWVKHRLVVKGYNVMNGQTDKLFSPLSEINGDMKPFLLHMDLRHRDDAGVPGQDRFGADASRLGLSSLTRLFINDPGNATHLQLNVMHGACKWGGICDSEFGYLATMPLLTEWAYRPNKRYMDGFDWDIENPKHGGLSQMHSDLLWTAFAMAMYESGGRFAAYSPEGIKITPATLQGVTNYWYQQDVVHVVFSSRREN